jgi:hypothetical protein
MKKLNPWQRKLVCLLLSSLVFEGKFVAYTECWPVRGSFWVSSSLVHVSLDKDVDVTDIPKYSNLLRHRIYYDRKIFTVKVAYS